MANQKVTVERDEDWEGPAGDTAQYRPLVGTAHDEALTAMAEWRDDKDLAGDFILESFYRMKGSPMYKSFLDAAKKPSHSPEDPDWNLAWSHAQMICVGILIARREFGRREPSPTDIKWDL